MTEQQKKDYYYGYNLRLADELGQFNEYITQAPTLKGLKAISENLEYKIMEACKGNPNRSAMDFLNESI